MRIIAHLDMDAFFAAVEERDKPRLAGKPLVVGADPEDGKGRGVVSTANYAARKYGIHSAMPISHAWQLAKEAEKQGQELAIFLAGSYERYGEVSDKIMVIIRKYAEHIEQASVDEAYIDLSYAQDFTKAEEICRKIKKDILSKEKLTASIGLAPNKLIAKIASDMHKPDGLTIITPDQVEKFLSPLPIRKVPGIGPKTEALFKSKGIEIIADIKKYSLEELSDMLGKGGEDIYFKAHGVDESLIVEEHEAKSIGQQETFRNDTLDSKLIFDVLKEMSASIEKEFKYSGFKTFRTVTISVRFSDFETKTRAHTQKQAFSNTDKIYTEAMKLFMPFLDKRENLHNKSIRLVGVRIEKLS